jgi:hypothetical protein
LILGKHTEITLVSIFSGHFFSIKLFASTISQRVTSVYRKRLAPHHMIAMNESNTSASL